MFKACAISRGKRRELSSAETWTLPLPLLGVLLCADARGLSRPGVRAPTDKSVNTESSTQITFKTQV